MSDADVWALVIAWSVAWGAAAVGITLADSGRARTWWLARVFDDIARGLEAGVRVILALLERGIRRAIPRRWQA